MISGTWDGRRIAVTDVGPVSHDEFGLQLPRPLPCAAPSGGWQLGAPSDAAIARLSDEVAGHPELYSAEGRVEVASTSGGPSSSVFWVGTVEDVSIVRDRLSAIFPGNLCVTNDPYSRSDLNAIAQRLLASANQEAWMPQVDPGGWDRVFVRLLVLDENASQLLGPDALALEVDPLVQRAAP
jgi:hypothetical protein